MKDTNSTSVFLIMKKHCIRLKKIDEGERLDLFLKDYDHKHSRSHFQKLISFGHVLVNDKKVKANYIVRKDDNITLLANGQQGQIIKAVKINLDLVYEDNDVLVVDKPAGIIVHPVNKSDKNTLINYLVKKIKINDKSLRPGIVHRLDKETSGLIIIGKNEKAHKHLVEEFKKRRVVKKYLALVKGRISPECGAIDSPISHQIKNYSKMTISLPQEGKDSFTNYRLIKYIGGFSLLEVRPITGRTHQIRVHLSAIGYPIAGDKLYSSSSSKEILPRQFLHACYLKIKLPSGKIKTFFSPLPKDLKNVLDILST